MTSEEIRAHVLLMFGSLGLLRVDCETPAHNSVDSDAAAAEGFCTPLALWNFVARIETGYNDNPYHNFRHAVDVTHTVYRYVTITEPRTHVTHVEKFALLVAALSHDLDHPGVNNAFLVNTKDRLATLYNDSSVLENSHIAFLYDLIATRQTRHAAVATRRPKPGALPRSDTHIGNARDTRRSSPSVCVSSDKSGIEAAPGAFPEPGANDEANIFAALDDSLYREVRRIIIATVLHTDMSHHFKMVSQMEVFYELHSEGIAANTRRVKRGIMVDCIYKKEEDRQFLLNVILHAADISNPVKPLDNYGKWSYRVVKEFFEQGDAERELGMTVSPMMDSATVNLAMSQINFIEFVVAPLYAVFGRLFPETSTTLARLVNNRMHYQALLERELDEVEPAGAKNCAGFVDGATPPPPGAHAGEGKTPEERSKERATTRARFRGMVEKHGIRHGAAGGLLGDSPPFRILMDAKTDTPLPPALTLEADGWLRRRSTDGEDGGGGRGAGASSSFGSRRGSASSSNTADGRSRMNSSSSSK